MSIKLSKLQKKHIELVREWRNLPEVAKYMYTDVQITKDEQEKWFNKISKDITNEYYIIEYDKIKIGVVSIYNMNKKNKSCSWAFYIANPNVRGAGIGSKVEYTILNRVFDELNYNRLYCEVFTFNEKVIKMHEKFGFRREAYYRDYIYKNGSFNDVVGLALLKSEWDLIKKTFINS